MIRKTLLSAVVIATAAGVLAVATRSSASQARDSDDRVATDRATPKCLDGQRTGRFHVVNDHTLLVYDEFGNPYKLDVGGACRGMSDFSTFGFEFTGSSDICRGHDAMVLRSEPPTHGVMRCTINSVTPMSRSDAAALDN